MKIRASHIVLGALCGLFWAGCANVGNPSGGPRDEDPPYLVRANPAPGARNVTRTDMTLTFNELVNVKDAFTKVVVSPAGRPPRVQSQGRNVTIRFDSLQPDMTYTVDFADAIEDNNENNKLQGFTYTFSTGPDLDSLRIAGRVFGARDLEPRPGILVGVHPNYPDSVMKNDSVFMKTPLLRVAKADDTGRFIIRGLAPGDYRVFAIMDTDGDFMFSSDREEVGFYDVAVTPTTEQVEAVDTLYNELGQVDTVKQRMRTRYLPNDVLIRTFVSDRIVQFPSKYERNDSNKLFLKMNAPATRYPDMRILDYDGPMPVMESREERDSITFWLNPELASRDSIFMAVSYRRIERGKAPQDVIDTLKFIKKKLPQPKKKKKEKISATDSLARITTTFKSLGESKQPVYEPLVIESATPLARLDTAMIHLSMQKDTVWTPLTKGVRITAADTLAPRSLTIDYPWDYGAKYRLEIDSVAGTDIYGKTTMPFNTEFSTLTSGDYCTLTFNMSGLDPGIPAFVELLDASDKPIRLANVENGRAFFPFLAPGKYYARVVEDYNGNGQFDTGDYEDGLQPDLVYYYPKVVNIKKNWDKEEAWDVFGTPIDAQKPKAVLKNKPKTPKRSGGKKKGQQYGQNEDEEDEDYFDPTANPFEENGARRGGGRFRQNSGNFGTRF